CGTGVWEMSEDVRAGRMARADLRRAESAMIRSRGHCNTMGTASTMACVAEALGVILTGEALRNAVRTVAAVGGSTNAVVHLLAIARRVGAPVTLADIDLAGRGIPLLADIQSAG